MHILFDIGATKTRIALADAHKDHFELPLVYHTPEVYEDGIRMFNESVDSLSGGALIESMVGGIAGPWDSDFGVIKNSGNLKDWDDKPLAKDIGRDGTISVYIDNDAAMAGLGESVFGAGKDAHKVLYITVSSGVGGAIIENNEIFERLEPRHIVVTEDGYTLGQTISGRGIEKKFGKKPKDIVDKVFWDHEAKILALGLSIILKEHKIDRVVIGGSIMSEIGISVLDTENYLNDLIKDAPPLVHSALGDFGGLYGALALIQKNSYNNPL